MKTLYTLCLLLPLGSVILAAEPPVKNHPTSMNDQSIRFSLIETYTDCEEEAGIFMIQEDGASSKVVELEQMNRTNPYEAYERNHRKFLYFMRTIGSESYVTKSIEVQDMNSCGTFTRYELEPREMESVQRKPRFASF